MKWQDRGWLWPELRGPVKIGAKFVITDHCRKCNDYTQHEYRKEARQFWTYRCLQCHPKTSEEHAQAKRQVANAAGPKRTRWGDQRRDAE